MTDVLDAAAADLQRKDLQLQGQRSGSTEDAIKQSFAADTCIFKQVVPDHPSGGSYVRVVAKMLPFVSPRLSNTMFDVKQIPAATLALAFGPLAVARAEQELKA